MHAATILSPLMIDAQRWAAAVMESHLAYPMLAFFRSSHDDQSWVGTLGTLLDAATLLMTTVEGMKDGQARIFYNVGRHAARDLSRYFPVGDRGRAVGIERSEFDHACDRLAAAGYRIADRNEAWQRFASLRSELRGVPGRAGAVLRDSAAPVDRRPIGDHDFAARRPSLHATVKPRSISAARNASRPIAGRRADVERAGFVGRLADATRSDLLKTISRGVPSSSSSCKIASTARVLARPLRIARVEHVQQQIGFAQLLERRSKRVDQILGQIGDEADRVGDANVRAGLEVGAANRRIERRKRLIGDVARRCAPSALSSDDLPTLV